MGAERDKKGRRRRGVKWRGKRIAIDESGEAYGGFGIEKLTEIVGSD